MIQATSASTTRIAMSRSVCPVDWIASLTTSHMRPPPFLSGFPVKPDAIYRLRHGEKVGAR